MIDLEQKIKELEFKIIDLENQLMMETMVKKSEVELNKELLERAEKHQLHIETLRDILAENGFDVGNKITTLFTKLQIGIHNKNITIDKSKNKDFLILFILNLLNKYYVLISFYFELL